MRSGTKAVSPRQANDKQANAAAIDYQKLLTSGKSDSALHRQIREAASTRGHLLIDNAFSASGADIALLQAMREFFELDDKDPRKQAIAVNDKPVKHGWMPLYGEPAYQPGTRARVESFDCGRPKRGEHDPLHSSVWPDLPGFHDATRAAWSELSTCGFTVLDAIASAFGLPAKYLSERCSDQDRSTMRLLNYPGQKQAAEANEVGIAAHTDFECITLLYQTAAGLELRDPRGEWHDAPSHNRRLTVLFGDMLENWTNGCVKATGHRVRMTREPRYSFVLFFAVNDGVSVAPLAQFVNEDLPAKYAAVTQQQHSDQEISQAERNRDQD